ncbi:MAG: hypothetical protein K0R65_1376 [Crocinitomicaceae bacterium]|jgi:uncharacterized protein YceH (UPF0502 family)|nr:hypothetical protein [Crocinitomicaceae bacterium]
MEPSLLPQLTAEELRVLGALIEKSKTTPDYYPLTLNSLHTACNQKSSRNPVVDYDEETVVVALDSLKKKQLIAHVIGGGRALKYRHTIAVSYPLDPAETSVLCLLMLRGPLTAGEINSNSGRLHEFDSLQEVQETLDNLANYETPFVQLLPKKPGQKEARYCHCFAEVPEFDDSAYPNEPARKNVSELEERLSKVETELAEVKEKLEMLMKELMG